MTVGLTNRHVRVLRLRYGFDASVGHTLAETGEQLGLSRQHVSWIEHNALQKIQGNPSVLDGTDFTNAQKAILLSREPPPRLRLAQCRSIERRYGQPLEQVLIGLIEKHKGKPHAIADEVGVHYKTIQKWRRELGLAKRQLQRQA